MEAAARQEDLQVLGEVLQERLHSQLPQGDFFQVRCAVKDGTLMILAQHPDGVTTDPEATFAQLEEGLQSLQPQVEQSVQIFIRVAGRKQPYTNHFFTLKPKLDDPVFDTEAIASSSANLFEFVEPESSFVLDNPEADELENGSSSTSGSEDDHTPYFLLGADPDVINQDPSSLWDQPTSSEATDSDGVYEDPSSLWGEPTSSEGIDSEPMMADEEEEEFAPLAEAPDLSSELIPVKRKPNLTPILIGGAVAGLAALIGGIYFLTRPCVIGGCKPIQTAQQIQSESTQLIRGAQSEQQLLVAQQQLRQATTALKPIPGWSSHYQQAQQLSQTMSAQSEQINQVLTALQKAASAQNIQTQPNTLQELQESQTLWQQAIAPLEAIRSNNELYGLAQANLPSYQASLKSVNQQLQAEQKTAKKVTQAKAVAQAAMTRQAAANSVQNWQQVQATWQVAINTLASVPDSSAIYQEAQQLMGVYQPKLVAARDRATREQIAANAYKRAVNSANLAKRYEQQQQWAAAVINWNRAVNAAKQVPNDTYYHAQAQPLVEPYSEALKQAEEKLQGVNILQKARADLNKTCSGAIRVCNFTVNEQAITVRLTSDYERAVERSWITGNVQRDNQTVAGVVDHLQILVQALEVIGDNANLPVVVYDSKGAQVRTHTPGS